MTGNTDTATGSVGPATPPERPDRHTATRPPRRVLVAARSGSGASAEAVRPSVPDTRARSMVPSTHAGIDAALAGAGRNVLITSTLEAGPNISSARIRGVDHDNLRRGVRYRVLFPDRVRSMPALSITLSNLALAGAEVRTAPDVPVTATVIDEALAVLPNEPRDGRPGGAAMVHLPGVVSAIVGLFERIWPSAVSLRGFDASHGTELSTREQELLALLSAGWTDESAAARLGISVRTVRRLMSGIMDRLGARSRFQAGVKAADRGWLAEPSG